MSGTAFRWPVLSGTHILSCLDPKIYPSGRTSSNVKSNVNSSNGVQKVIDLQSIPKSPRRSLKSPGAPLKFPLLSRNYVIEESDFSSAHRCNLEKLRPVFKMINNV